MKKPFSFLRIELEVGSKSSKENVADVCRLKIGIYHGKNRISGLDMVREQHPGSPLYLKDSCCSFNFQPPMATQYFIPDLLVTWPWKRLINPMLVEVDDEANAWVKSLDLLEPAQLPKFSSCRFSTCCFFLAMNI
jgi:hypothetical protein